MRFTDARKLRLGQTVHVTANLGEIDQNLASLGGVELVQTALTNNYFGVRDHFVSDGVQRRFGNVYALLIEGVYIKSMIGVCDVALFKLGQWRKRLGMRTMDAQTDKQWHDEKDREPQDENEFQKSNHGSSPFSSLYPQYTQHIRYVKGET